MLDTEERTLYEGLWNNGYKKSQCAIPLIAFLEKHCTKEDTLLEIGSGDGTTLRGLKAKGYKVTGTDIYSTSEDIIECPAWRLPSDADVTFSTDVLEHIPEEKIDETIREILRRTIRKTIHIIACWPDIRNGINLHKTVKPIAWWQEKFSALNTNKEILILDRDGFL